LMSGRMRVESNVVMVMMYLGRDLGLIGRFRICRLVV